MLKKTHFLTYIFSTIWSNPIDLIFSQSVGPWLNIGFVFLKVENKLCKYNIHLKMYMFSNFCSFRYTYLFDFLSFFIYGRFIALEKLKHPGLLLMSNLNLDSRRSSQQALFPVKFSCSLAIFWPKSTNLAPDLIHF